MSEPAMPVPAGSSPPIADTSATPAPTATHSAALTSHDAVE